ASGRESKVYVVDPGGSDAHGDGTRRHPWRTLARACSSVPGGLASTIYLSRGTYVESRTCRLPCETNLRGSGSGSTTLKGPADPLVAVENCTRGSNTQTVAGIRLDGQNKAAGKLGMKVRNVRGLTIRDLRAEGFRGTPSGGALDIDRVWNADVGDSIFRNSGATFGSYASGTLGIRNAADSVFHDLDVYDAKYLA